MHGKLPQQAEVLGRLAGSKLKVGKLEALHISPVLAVHTGPGWSVLQQYRRS